MAEIFFFLYNNMGEKEEHHLKNIYCENPLQDFNSFI